MPVASKASLRRPRHGRHHRPAHSPAFRLPLPWLGWLALALRALIWPRASLALENVALRQQLNVLRRSVAHPRLTDDDRLFWLVLHRLHGGWAGLLQVVSPRTVLRWHQAGWRRYWAWRCQRRRTPGRPPIGWPLVKLIRRLSRENVTWGARRIHDELELLGHTVGVETVRRYMVRRRRPKCGQHWKTFLKNHLNVTAACDFFTVPTATFRSLFVLVILSHDRRLIRRVAVTAHPTAAWTVEQVAAAFPDERPAYLVHDRQKMFQAKTFLRKLDELGIEDRKTDTRQSWQNAHCERAIGTLRRDCTDHVIVLGERHLQRLLDEYVTWYNRRRTHFSLGGNAPVPRPREMTPAEEVVAASVLGGLHHSYERAA